MARQQSSLYNMWENDVPKQDCSFFYRSPTVPKLTYKLSDHPLSVAEANQSCKEQQKLSAKPLKAMLDTV